MVSLLKIGASVAILFIAPLSFAQPPRPPQPPVVHTATVGACTFRLTDSLGGRLDDSDKVSVVSHADYNVELARQTLPAAFHIAFGCDTRDPVQVCREFAALITRRMAGWNGTR